MAKKIPKVRLNGDPAGPAKVPLIKALPITPEYVKATFISSAAVNAKRYVFIDLSGKVGESSPIFLPKTIGVSLTSASAANQPIDVAIAGVTTVVAGGTVSPGDTLKLTSGGRAVYFAGGHKHSVVGNTAEGGNATHTHSIDLDTDTVKIGIVGKSVNPTAVGTDEEFKVLILPAFY